MSNQVQFQARPKGGVTKQLPMYIDELGELLPVYFKDVPFIPKRIFTVVGCPPGATRGDHAHKQTKQYAICVQGIIKVLLINKAGRTEHTLKNGCALLIDTMTWDKLQFMTGNDVLLVFCDTEYDSSDYILNFEEFNKMLSNENNGGNDRP